MYIKNKNFPYQNKKGTLVNTTGCFVFFISAKYGTLDSLHLNGGSIKETKTNIYYSSNNNIYFQMIFFKELKKKKRF